MKQISKTINRLSISGLLLILICSGCHLQNGTESMDEDDWEESETEDTIRIGELLSEKCESDENESLKKGTFTVSFDSLHEAETKLLAVLDPYVQDEVGGRYRNNNELVEVVMNHPETLHYPFSRLVKKEYVDIYTSEDGNLRFYCWDTGYGGSSIDYKVICQYQSNGTVYGSLLNGGEPLNLFTVKSPGKETFYIVHYYARESSISSSVWLESLTIRNGKLVYYPVFPDNAYQLFLNENGPGWLPASYDEIYDNWETSYNPKEKNLYIPLVLDLFDVYHYNGETFEYQGKKAGNWLHPEIREYSRLLVFFYTDDFRIRIDRMENGSCRYTSWSKKKKMSDRPDCIIYDGTYDKDKNSYIFRKDNYRYEVNIEHKGFETNKKLLVYKNDKRILCQDALN